MMKLEDLVQAILDNRPLDARQWVADAQREGVRFDQLPPPELQSPEARALAAGIVELLAARGEQIPPAWSTQVPALADEYFVSPQLRHMKRSAADARLNGPEPLRRRNIVAPVSFLSIV